MAIYGEAITVTLTAIDISDGSQKTGDAANITPRLIRDGTSAAATNGVSEVDASNAPGEYSLALTAAEMQVDTIIVAGVSSTSDIEIVPVKLVTEGQHLLRPTTAGRTLDVDASGRAASDAEMIDNSTEGASGVRQLGSSQANAGGVAFASASSQTPDGTAWSDALGDYRDNGGFNLAADAVDGDSLATAAINAIRNAITGGAYSLDTDANGRIRLVAGTGAGEISLSSGLVSLIADGVNSTTLADSAAAKIEAALLNEGDGQALIDAIVQAIDDADISTNLTVALIRDGILNRALSGNHDTSGTVGAFLQRLDAAVTSRSGHSASEAGSEAASAILATPANKLTTNGDGEVPSSNMRGTDNASTHSAASITGGTTVAQAESNIRGGDNDDLKDISDEIANIEGGGGGGGLTQQQVRDALKLAPTSGSPADGSTDAEMDTLLSRTSGEINIHVSNPLAEDNTLTIYRGIDYSIAAGNAPSWSQDDWPEGFWSGAGGTFRYKQDSDQSVTTPGTVSIAQDGSTLTATLTLTDDETAALTKGDRGWYELEIEASGGAKRMLASGQLRVRDDVT